MPTTYDEDQQAQPGYVPDDDSLRAITGTGKDEEANMEKSAQEGTAADQAERQSLGLPGAGGEDKAGVGSAAAAAAGSVATNAAINAATGGAGGTVTTAAKMAKFFWGNRKRKSATVGGGIGIGTVGACIVGFMLLLAPLKIVNMVQNLQDHFFGASEEAATDMSERLMQRYIVKKLMPGMVDQKCRSTLVNKSCAKASDGSTPVGQLFNAWKDARIENKMAQKYGIELVRNGNSFLLRTPNIRQGIALGQYSDTIEYENKVYAKLSRGEVRAEVRSTLKTETGLVNMMHRYGVGPLMERKYGVKRCIIACQKRDKFTEKVESKKVAFKSYLNERVLAPRDELISLAFDCAMSSFACAQGDEVGDDGSHTSQFDRDVQEKLAQFAASHGQDDLDKLFEKSKLIREKGLMYGVLERLTTETTAKATALAGEKGIPIIGWIDLGANLISAMRQVGPALSKINYSLYSSMAVSTYALYRTSADELKTGKVDGAVVGSIADSLNAVPGGDQGGVSAEQTKLYQKLNHTSSQSTASTLLPSAYADESNTATFKQKCDNSDDKIAADETECPEMIVGLKGILGGISALSNFYRNAPMLNATGIGIAADKWVEVENSLFGKVFDLLGDLLGFLNKLGPFRVFYEGATAVSSKLIEAIVKSVGEHAFPSQITNKVSGGRNYEVAAAGADFSANEYCHYNLGCHKVTDAQAEEIRTARAEERRAEFNNKSLYARLFDTNDTQSFVSHMALAMPSSVSSGTTSLTSTLISNPLGTIFNSFGSLISGRSQAAVDAKDPFGISQYALTSDDLSMIGDPEVFWKANCSNIEAANKKWGEAAQLNEDTGQYENTTPNLCQTLQTATMVAGGKYDTSLIPNYQSETSSDGGTAAGGTFTIGTYNILHAEDHKDNSIGTGNCSGSVLASDPLCAKTRSARQVQIVTGQGAGVNNPAFDVFGTQETSPTQYRILKQSLTNYDVFPTNPDHMNNREQGAVAIWWDKTKFKLADSGTAPGVSNTARDINVPWVKLETLGDPTHPGGQQFYFMSIHYSQHDCSDQNCLNDSSQATDDANMRRSAELTREWVQSKSTDSTPVFVVGDTNDNLTQKLSYCILTRGALMQNTWDMSNGVAANPDKPCPTNRNNGIDQLYATPNKVSATNWTHLPNSGIYATASDHTPVYTTVTIESDTTGWVWPAQKIYPGPCWNSHSTGEYHAGMDMNVRQSGLKANAAHSGTVYRVGTDPDAGNYVTVKVSDHLYYSYEHLQSVAVKEKDEVLAGQELGTIGRTGNVQLSSATKGHLHMVVSVDGELGGYSSSPQTNSNTRNPLNYLPKNAPSNYTCTN